MKSVIISGATGAIGMALIRKLLEENIKLLVLCRKNSPRIQQIPEDPRIDICYCGLNEFNLLQNDSGVKYDVFYHFAWDGTFGSARNDIELQYRNVKYALDAVNLAHRFGCHTFVGAGSQAEYGRVEGELRPETPAFPETGYGIAKLCAGQMTRELCRQHKMRHIWTRILSVYGPYDGADTMVMSTIRKFVNGEIPLFTKGEQIWDYLYSGDAANALYLLGKQGMNGKVYLLGSGEARPLKDYILDIRDAVNPKMALELGALPYSEKQVMHLSADISELINDTRISTFTSFQDGIRETIKYWNAIND